MENDLGTKTISEALFIFEFNNLLYKDIQRRLKWMQTVVDTEPDTEPDTVTHTDPDSYPYTDLDMNPNNTDWLLLINKTTKCITKIKSINNELFEELKEITKDLPPETGKTFSAAVHYVFGCAGAWRDRKLAQRRLNQKEPTLPPQDSLNGNQNNQDYKMALLEDIVSNMVVIKNFYSLLVDIRGELRNSLNNPKADAFIEKMTEQGYYLKETSKDLKGRLRYISYTGDNTLLQKIIT